MKHAPLNRYLIFAAGTIPGYNRNNLISSVSAHLRADVVMSMVALNPAEDVGTSEMIDFDVAM